MRPEKAFIVEDLLSRLQASPFLIITDYHGLKVDQFSDLRTRLAGAGAKYTVVKTPSSTAPRAKPECPISARV